ncbi:sensor histidine kinase [Actinophytocola xanthii]|uniref:histidine kinase n=1 Tax=Actinophytocola xanthii TaxID=1912961 RepID=A0A1Q8CYF0_9PSEU|nr:HAMP domain-containing sensor histidine kinase [Actinophytocola xanthii]OLF19378.1 hypothetical protein BU204_00140 [Actinophytocola xanthii]
MRVRWPRSIRGRLLTGVLGLSLVALLVAEVAVLLAFRDYLGDRTDRQLRAIGERIEEALAGRGQLRVREGQVAALVPDGVVVLVRGEVRGEERPLVSIAARGGETSTLGGLTRTEPVTVRGADRDLRAVSVPVPGLRLVLDGEPVAANTAVIALDVSDEQDALRNLVTIELVVAGVAAVVLVLVSGTVLRVGLRPLRAMAASAEDIASGRLGTRLPQSPPDTETAALAAALNRAFDARERAERGLRDFVADASHELRTPLTLIHGWADLSLQGGLPDGERTQAAMERIATESARMRALVDELLLLARLDARQPLARDLVDLGPVVDEVLADARVVAPDRAISREGVEGAVVRGDEARLRQVVRNLVGNATRHTPPGTRVRVGLEVGERVTLRVRDDGPGIPDEELPRVFERFHRAGRERAGGSGLGLSIVAAVVEAHGGTVRAEASATGGTVFVVALPRADLQETLSSGTGRR